MTHKIRPLILCLMVLVFAAPALAGGCNWYTTKGSVLESSGDEINLCVGTKDGAAVGQELDVYKIVHDANSWWGLSKEYAGKIKITGVLDEHSAKATVISGKADVDSIVELSIARATASG